MIVSNLPLITSAFLNVTNACNLACRYCFVEQHPNYMTFDVAKDAADFLAENCDGLQSPSITFFGGEPMLCWNSVVRPLVDYVRSKYGFRYSLGMTTNGTLLTKDIIEYLYRNNVSLMISIDGNQETQDYNRPKHSGESSFIDIEKILDTYIKFYPNSTFRSTIIPETAHLVFENIIFAEKIGYQNYFLIPNVFQGWSEDAKSILKSQMRKISLKYIADCKNGKDPMSFSTLNDSFQHIVRINETKISGCGNCICAKDKCGLGQSQFASIDWRGRLFACQEMVSCKGENDLFYMGDIFSGVKNNKRIQLGELFSVGRISGYNCENCKLRSICNAGCVANNYMVCGDINKVPDIFCWWEQTLLDEAIFIMNSLGKKNNPGYLRFLRNGWNFAR